MTDPQLETKPASSRTLNPGTKIYDFATRIAEGDSPVEAARKVYQWPCERGSYEAHKARNLAASARVKQTVATLRAQAKREDKAYQAMENTDRTDWSALRQFAHTRLVAIRDNPRINGQSRFLAIQALERLSDPSRDIALILRWMNLIWQSMYAHCPCCHKSFPLARVRNERITAFRKAEKMIPIVAPESHAEGRINLLRKADLRNEPHPGQKIILSAPERHVVGTGPARTGKSRCLAQMLLLSFLCPGSETWLLARVYDDARSEIEYLKEFLKTLFHPFEQYMFTERFDFKTGEATLVGRWGSELKVKSGKSQGSLTGRELDMVGVAEPGWVDDKLYEEVRARLSTRLGRIIALGTPKGFGGFLGRMVRSTGRDPVTGKILRRRPEERLIANGSPWNTSMLVTHLNPQDNPAYVQSELSAARMELNDIEFESEFEGKMSSLDGAKFSEIKPHHLRPVTLEEYSQCGFVLGVDQGEKNFGACLVGFNGRTAYVAREYFECSDNTIKKNLMDLQVLMKKWRYEMGNPHYVLTIMDTHPLPYNILLELENEGRPWPTPVTYKPLPKTYHTIGGWRAEATEYVNELAKSDRLWFDSAHCDLIHDQCLNLLSKQEKALDSDSTSYISKKGWKIADGGMRGDHVLDAWFFAMFTIMTSQVKPPEAPIPTVSPFEAAHNEFQQGMLRNERKDLSGFYQDELWRGKIPSGNPYDSLFGGPGHYVDES